MRSEADALVELARFCIDIDLSVLISNLDRAQLLYQQLGDLRGEAICLMLRGLPLQRRGRAGQARSELARALEIARHLGDRDVESRVLNVLGIVTEDGGGRRDYYLQALEANALVGDLPLRALCLNNLSLAYAQLGLYRRARETVEQAVRFQRD